MSKPVPLVALMPPPRGATQARRRQQLKDTLREIHAARCTHWNAAAVGTTEAHQVRGGWMYRTPYQCPDCGLRFTETHGQAAARSDAVV